MEARFREAKRGTIWFAGAGVVLIFVAILTYFPAFTAEYSMDDMAVITGNVDLATIPTFKWLFSRRYFEFAREDSYRPVVTISHLLDSRWWGPEGAHTINVALHAAIGALLAVIGHRLGLPSPASLLGATLFLVHPAYSEAVYVVTLREDLLSAFFLLLALWMYLRGFLWLAQLPFALALFSKEMAIPFPAMVAVLAYIRRGSIQPRQILAACGTDMIYLLIRFWILPSPNVPTAFPSMIHWAPAEIRILLNYLRLLIWPDILSIDHRTSLVKSISAGLMILGSAVVVFSIYGLIGSFRRRSLNAFFFSSGVILSTPIMNILTTNNESAERFLYVPMMFPALGIGSLVYSAVLVRAVSTNSDKPRDPPGRGLEWAVVIGVLMALAARTHMRGHDFQTYRHILHKELEINPRSYICAYMLGLEYEPLNAAMAQHWAEQCLKINDEFYPARLFLSRLEMSRNRLIEARQHLDYVLRTQPIDADVAFHVAAFYLKKGDTHLAKEWAVNATLTKSRWPSQMIYDILRDVRRQVWGPARGDTRIVPMDQPQSGTSPTSRQPANQAPPKLTPFEQ